MQAITTGVVVALIGFTSSFAIVLQGLRAAGASEAEAASGLMALCVAMGLSGIILSAKTRMPISVAWSTPGAALLISSSGTITQFSDAVGAFIVCALLLMLSGWYRPLGKLVEAIPASLANAMLAGILLLICLAPVRAIAFDATIALPVVLVWWLIGQFRRAWALPAALALLAILMWWRSGLATDAGQQFANALHLPLQLISPTFNLGTLVSIALPLFIVTMASQNVPGVAVQRANGYATPAGPMILNTGLFSLLSAPFGGHAVNLAALTAAICCGQDAHPDPQRRYWAAIVAGLMYIVLGLFAGVIGLLMTLVPTVMIEAIAGLALINAFIASVVAAFAEKAEREAAAITFLLAASGVALAGIGGAFWGLLAGIAIVRFNRWWQRRQRNHL